MSIIESNWLIYGLVTGCFWGLFAVFVYVPYDKLGFTGFIISIRSIFIILFQFLLSFVGGFTGWFSLKLFLTRFSANTFGFPEITLLFIAIIGISGKISDLIYLLPDAVRQGIQKYTKQ